MNTQELKRTIIKKIEEIDNDAILMHLLSSINIEINENGLLVTEEPRVMYVTDEQIKMIEESREELRMGLLMSDEEVRKEMNDLLKD